METDKIIEKVYKLYDKYGVDKGFLDALSDEKKIKGMKGILAELDLKKKADYEVEDLQFIQKIYAMFC